MQVLPGERGEKFLNEFAVMAPLKFHSWRAAPPPCPSYVKSFHGKTATPPVAARSLEERRLLPDRESRNRFPLLPD